MPDLKRVSVSDPTRKFGASSNLAGRIPSMSTGSARTPSGVTRPSLRVERAMLRSGAQRVACIDEVGRGALAGPATVGVVTVVPWSRPAPTGVGDSKTLTPATRAALRPKIESWAEQWAVGNASASEIDSMGIIEALGLAAARALSQLTRSPDAILLDGPFDYLTRTGNSSGIDVCTRVGADLQCSAVAAASILAKTSRDRHMEVLDKSYPGYGWSSNKGYGSAQHYDAIRELGTTLEHRMSFRLSRTDK